MTEIKTYWQKTPSNVSSSCYNEIQNHRLIVRKILAGKEEYAIPKVSNLIKAAFMDIEPKSEFHRKENNHIRKLRRK